MGIIETYLGEMELEDGTGITIELHDTGNVQMNVGPVSFGFTQEEFIAIAETIEEGHAELFELKDRELGV